MLSAQPYDVDVMVEKRIAVRAYYYWERRGRPLGTPEVDWYRAVSDEKHETETRGLMRA